MVNSSWLRLVASERGNGHGAGAGYSPNVKCLNLSIFHCFAATKGSASRWPFPSRQTELRKWFGAFTISQPSQSQSSHLFTTKPFPHRPTNSPYMHFTSHALIVHCRLHVPHVRYHRDRLRWHHYQRQQALASPLSVRTCPASLDWGKPEGYWCEYRQYEQRRVG